MAETVAPSVGKVDFPQRLERAKTTSELGRNFPYSQQEALRKATLLKHRKISTQLKLDMVQRQLTDLRRSVRDSDTDRQFYRLQMKELSNELHDLGTSLEKVERNAFYARKRILRRCGMDVPGIIPLSASHPTIYSSSETLDQNSARSGLKNRMSHLMSSPSSKFRKRHLLGELRAVASLTSLNTKSSSHSSCEDVIASKDTKPWKAPLKFLGHLVDSGIRRRLWGAKRTKSVDNIEEDKKQRRLSDAGSKDSNGFRTSGTDDCTSSSSSSESSAEEEEEEEWCTKNTSKHIWPGPVVRKVSSSQRAQIDPAILAEIEDFERMAAQYIKQHS